MKMRTIHRGPQRGTLYRYRNMLCTISVIGKIRRSSTQPLQVMNGLAVACFNKYRVVGLTALIPKSSHTEEGGLLGDLLARLLD